MSKVTTLGPLCYLLNSYVSQHTTFTEEQILYRGMTLTTEMIEEYKEAVDTEIEWPAFTSTTTSLAVAEAFIGNTLCIIRLRPGRFVHGKDISDISHMPDEEEFLLSVGFMLYVEQVNFDLTEKRHLIYLKSTCHE